QLGERAVVDQPRQALARGELFGSVLAGDLLLATAQLDLRAARVQILDQRAQQRSACLPRVAGAAFGGRFLGRAHQRPFHCGWRFSKNALTPSTMSSVDMASVSWARR